MNIINKDVRVDKPSKSIVFNKISYYSYIVLVALLPVFFIPFTNINFDIAKGYLIAISIFTSFSFWLLSRLMDGGFSIPKTPLIFASLSTVGFFILSSIFSVAPVVSFIGSGFDIGTTGNIIMLFLALFLGSMLFQGSNKKSNLYFFILLSGIVCVLWQLILVFVGPNTLGIDIFPLKTTNLVGKWTDFAIFLGGLSILAVMMIELLKVARIQKIALWIFIAVAIFFLMLVDSSSVWYMVGLMSLLIFIYTMTVNKSSTSSVAGTTLEKQTFPITSFAVVLISLVFILANTFVGDFLSAKLDIYNIEFRPSIYATIDVLKPSFAQDPVFGVGPNRFVNAWAEHRPVDILSTRLWNIDFIQGFGFLPTFLVTGGILVFLSVLFFSLYFIYLGVKKAFSFSVEPMANFMLLSSFVISLYFLVFLWITTPSITNIFLTFTMVGIFIGTLSDRKLIDQYKFSFLNDARKSFFAILCIVILFISTLSGMYIYTKKFVSVAYAVQGFSRMQDPDRFNKAENSFIRSAEINPSDFAYKNLSGFYQSKMNILFNSSDLPEDFIKSQFQSYFSNAENSAKLALSMDSTNYANWIVLGNLYRDVVPFGIKGAYESAKSAYERSLSLSPRSPATLLALARLEFSNKNNSGARDYITQALNMKPNYVDAILFRASIEYSENNINLAIKDTEEALYFDQTNLDAEYFLGILYEKAGRHSDAISIFKNLDEKVPDNTEITKMLKNLQNGIPVTQSEDSGADSDTGVTTN